MNKLFIVAVLLSSLSSYANLPPTAITADQAARVAAGMTAKGAGVYALWSANQAGSRVNIQQQSLIREFSRTHLSGAYQNTQTVFYPFGGPDVIFPSLFFPHMKTLILAGLENPGALPKDLASAQRRIAEVARAYSAVFNYGYYITQKMSSDLREFGTSTMISVGLVLMGNTIVSVEQPTEHSVKITYTSPPWNDVKEVYYFQQDLSDGSKKSKGVSQSFIDFVQSKQIDTTFYKASSYVPQRADFAKVRALALSGRYFVQSDTGLTIATFTGAGNWDVHLFGQYVQPSRIFGVGLQSPLKSAYAAAICESGDAKAMWQYQTIWAANPCPGKNGKVLAGPVKYEGALPFPFDYAGKLSRYNVRELSFASSFIYAVRR
jgi:hypothetical protein